MYHLPEDKYLYRHIRSHIDTVRIAGNVICCGRSVDGLEIECLRRTVLNGSDSVVDIFLWRRLKPPTGYVVIGKLVITGLVDIDSLNILCLQLWFALMAYLS